MFPAGQSRASFNDMKYLYKSISCKEIETAPRLRYLQGLVALVRAGSEPENIKGSKYR